MTEVAAMPAADWLRDLPAAGPADETFAIDEVVPQAVAEPRNAADVVEVLHVANRQGFTVVPWGGGTKQTTGAVPDEIGVAIRSHRLNRLLHYDPGDLTLGVGAGMTVTELQAELAKFDQFLPLDVAQPEKATVGGVLATAAHGPLRAGFGGVRDYCIGIEFVTGDGTLAKAGGKVVKNVAGYDLMKLMIGSYGTLGVITAANFKVFPRPRQTRTFEMSFSSAAEAMAARDRIVRSPIGNGFLCLELLSPRAAEYLTDTFVARDPDDYAPSGPLEPQSTWRLLLRAAGSDAVLARYRRELGVSVARELQADEETQHWRSVSEFASAVAQRHRNAIILQLNCSLAGVARSVTAAEEAAVEHNFIFAAVGRAIPGALVVALMPLSVDPPSATQYAAAVSALRGSLPRDAFAVVVRCPVEAKRHFDVWGATTTDREQMRRLRAALDPRHILNRGRFMV